MSHDETSVVSMMNDCYSLDLRLPSMNPGLDDVSFDGLPPSSLCEPQLKISQHWDSCENDTSPSSLRSESNWFESTFNVIAQSESDLGVAVNPNIVLPNCSSSDELNKKHQKNEDKRDLDQDSDQILNLDSVHTDIKFDRPSFSYVCLIGLALKNSRSGCLPVSVIYKFLSEHFPYFRSAPNGWKNSIRHNLSLNKCFEKLEKPAPGGSVVRKTYYWAVHPSKKYKVDQEIVKCCRKDPAAARKCMTFPEKLDMMEKGELKTEHLNDDIDEASPAVNLPFSSLIFTFDPTFIRAHKVGIPPSTRKS